MKGATAVAKFLLNWQCFMVILFVKNWYKARYEFVKVNPAIPENWYFVSKASSKPSEPAWTWVCVSTDAANFKLSLSNLRYLCRTMAFLFLWLSKISSQGEFHKCFFFFFFFVATAFKRILLEAYVCTFGMIL